jgi:predicted phosphoribosyltransferase
MYFHNRAEAGEMLAEQMKGLRYENTAVMALSAGGVLVGEQIARRLHSTLSLLLISDITLPGDDSFVVGTMDHTGLYTENSMVPAGEMEEVMADMHSWLEEAKLHKLFEMTTLVGEHGLTDPHQLAGRNVIIVTDGIQNGLSYVAARHFLGIVHIEKTYAAIPVGPFDSVERVRPLVDEVHCLYHPDNFLDVPHYYTDESEVKTADVIWRIDDIVKNWI